MPVLVGKTAMNSCSKFKPHHALYQNYFKTKYFFHSFTSDSQSRRHHHHHQKSFFEQPNISRDALISRLCKDHNFKQAIDILCEQNRLKDAVQLLDSKVKNSHASIYSTLIQYCVKNRELELGKRVHGHMKNSGFVPGTVISNRVIDMYGKCDSLVDAQKVFDEMTQRDLCSWNTLISGYAKMGQLDNARKMFDEMPQRDDFSWTAMISGYVRYGHPKEALELYRELQMVGKEWNNNKFTVSSALAAAAALPCLNRGKEIHCRIMRLRMESDEVVWSALCDMYGKCGSVEEARYIFDKMGRKDVVSWTAMIDMYFGDGRREEGFSLFSELMRSSIRPNEFTFAGVLNACADHAAEELGKQVHGHMMRIGFDPVSFAASALIHMYSKCGNMEYAKRVFEGIPHHDVASWTSLIVGYAQNGHPEDALELYESFLRSGIKPDHITFVGVLSACTHAGLVNKGLKYFNSITEMHGLTQTADHYACIIDLLARAGRFKEAEEIICNMPLKPDRFLWASLLGGCRIHGNLELAKKAAEALFEIEPKNPATYITMANIYATAGLWDEVAEIRKSMERGGVVKKPGLSWIEVKRKVYVFLVGDTSSPKLGEIYAFLEELSRKMKEGGYVPDTNVVLHDVEEEQKEQNLVYHSEKLAVAYGIISTPPGTSLKIFKNLRTCVDCHTAFKFISKIEKRKIVVRDSNRFHCFEGGACSCRDYW